MSAIRLVAFGTIALLSLNLIQAAGLGDPKPPAKNTVYMESQDNTGLIMAPIRYSETMVIVVTDDGVAAIVFQEKDPKITGSRSPKYRYRFLKDAESEEITGGGIVLDNPDNLEEKTVKAGPIRLGWSGGGPNDGAVFYEPEEMQVSTTHARRFEDRLPPKRIIELEGREAVVQPTDPIPKLDLKRFLKKKK